MPNKNLSVAQIKAIAEKAITTRTAADAAKTAFDANPTDESLKAAYDTAESAATTAKSEADALSQQTTAFSPEQIAKKKRKLAIIQNELRQVGALDDDGDEDDDDADDLDDPDRVVTVKDLQRIETKRASETAAQMADAIPDLEARQAVKDSLARLVPSGDANKDFADAVAIANREKNSKVLEELGRKPLPVQHRSGGGAPPKKPDAEFVPTAYEAGYMKAFKLTKEDVLKARAEAATAFPNQ